MTIRIDLDDETARRLQSLSVRSDYSSESLARAAIEAYLGFEETREEQRPEDERRWQRYLETGVHVPESEMHAVFDRLRARMRRG